METVWGVKWPIPSFFAIASLVFVLILVILFFSMLRYFQYLKRKEHHAHELFLLKAKESGLSNNQFNILNSMEETLKIKDSPQILKDPDLFERAISQYLETMEYSKMDEASLLSICKDIVITYERLYHYDPYKVPLLKSQEIENNSLICIHGKPGGIHIGKIIKRDAKGLTAQILCHTREINEILNNEAEFFLWRSGDAEYTFKSLITKFEVNYIEIKHPEGLERGKEARHPYVDIIVPCKITEKETPEDEAKEKTKEKPEEQNENAEEVISGTIYKINEAEAVMRFPQRLNYQKQYLLDFSISDFNFSIDSSIIADRTIKEKGIYYYTIKFNKLSDAAKNMLKQYVAEHL